MRDSLRKPVTRDARQPGPYPYFGANGVQDWVSGYIFDGEYLLVGEDGSVINVDGTPVVNWLSGKAWVNNHAHVLEASDPSVNLRFLFYFLSQASVSEFVTGGSQKKINQGNLLKIPVQLPSRSRQDDIVEFLDKFSTLLGDISSGLPAELMARRNQYEYYRNQLLTFKVAS